MTNTMRMPIPRLFAVRRACARTLLMSLVGMVTLTSGMVGCSALDVNDPLIVTDESLNNPIGANDLWTVARVRLFDATEASAIFGGIFADEFFVDAPLNSTSASLLPYYDRRESLLIEARTDASNFGTGYQYWQQLRSDATVALPKVRSYAAKEVRDARLGELFAFRGFAALRLAEDYCPGFPLREIADFKPIYGPPLTTDQAFESTLAEFDSAMAYGKDSARVLDFARLGKARALLGLGRYAEANVLSAAVAAGFDMRGASTLRRFDIYMADWQPVWVGISDREGGSALDFVSAADPRVGLRALRKARYVDTSTMLYAPEKYPSVYNSFVVANDIEARLIQAEAALNAHDPAWLTILNELRQTKITPTLPALNDPGSFDAQVDLLFRERAFWLFATGHRLGDLRRLIKHYGRSPATVFPSGSYRPSGTYGTGTSLPFNSQTDSGENPAVTGCTSR